MGERSYIHRLIMGRTESSQVAPLQHTHTQGRSSTATPTLMAMHASLRCCAPSVPAKKQSTKHNEKSTARPCKTRMKQHRQSRIYVQRKKNTPLKKKKLHAAPTKNSPKGKRKPRSIPRSEHTHTHMSIVHKKQGHRRCVLYCVRA